jgi:Chitobiase/beta-hexosaminidase C-terminal domain
VATPFFNRNGGEFAITQARPVTISTTTVGAKIYYTVNGTIPNPSQNNGIVIPSNRGTNGDTNRDPGTTLRAIAFADGMSDSDMQEANIKYVPYPLEGRADDSSGGALGGV